MKALYHKEFKEHGLPFVILLTLEMGLFLFFLLMFHLNPNRGSYLMAFRAFMMLGFPFGAVYLGYRFISREYTGKTQFFLEALPVSRFQVLLAKLQVSLLFNLLPTLLAFGICLVVAGSQEVLGLQHGFFMLMRALAYMLFFHTGALAVGFLGRYRIAGLISMVLTLIAIDMYSEINLVESGPLSLIYDERFCFERQILPVADLLSALGGAGFFMAVCFLMVLTREGSMAAMLAEKMSHREKVFVACMVIGCIAVLITLDERNLPEPFELKNSIVASGEGPAVSIAASGLANERDLAELSNWVQGELEKVRAYLGMKSMTPVFLTLRGDLDPGVFELGNLEGAVGLMVRLRYDPEEFQLDKLMIWLIPHALTHATEGRVLLEKNRWLLDGFAHFISLKDAGYVPENLVMQAMYGAPDDLSMDTLDNWLLFREKVGVEVARGVAWHGLRTFEKLAGENACKQLLRSKLGLDDKRYFHATIQEFKRPLKKEMRLVSGIKYESFIEAWREELNGLHRQFPEILKGVPHLKGELKSVALSEGHRRLEFRLIKTQGLELARRVSFRYLPLGLHDEEIKPEQVRAEEMTVSKMLEWRKLPNTFSRGTRFAWAISMRSEILECDITTGWTRLELP